MADGNGTVALPETSVFRIGGRDIRVPSLSLWDLEVSKRDIMLLSPELDWIEYGFTVVRIVARKIVSDKDDAGDIETATLALSKEMSKKCSVEEIRNLTSAMNDLLRVSGFVMPGEAEAANPGTGTLTESPPNSPLPLDVPMPDTSNV